MICVERIYTLIIVVGLLDLVVLRYTVQDINGTLTDLKDSVNQEISSVFRGCVSSYVATILTHYKCDLRTRVFALNYFVTGSSKG